ncbi:MAG: histidine kinase [Bacteroidota bacterium]
MPLIKPIINLLLCCCSNILLAQGYHFKTYTTKDGLSSNNVGYVFKDSKGFLWCSTPNGLNRFDGNAFDVYNNNPADSTTIASNNIQTIYEDSRRQLWAGTLSGISLYHPETQRFSNYAPDTTLCRPGRVYHAMIEDKQHQFWIGTAYELLNFDPVSKKFSRSGWIDFINSQIPAKDRMTRVLVLGFAKKNEDELWILTTYGLCSVVTATHRFTFYPFKEVEDYYGCQLNYYDSSEGAVWIGSYNNGLLRYNSYTNEWKKIPTPPVFLQKKDFDWAYCIKPLSGDTLMYCSQNGMMVFDKRKEAFLRLIADSTGENKTYSGAFSNYYLKDGNKFWICTPTGLVLMQSGQNRFRFTSLAASKPDEFVRNIHFSNFNKLLIAGHDNPGRFYAYNEKTGEQIAIKLPGGKQLTAHLDRIAELPDGSAFMSTDEALYLLNQRTLTATELAPKLPNHIATDVIYRNVVMDKTGIAWIRTRRHGIIRYDPKTKSSEPLAAVPARDGRAFRMIFYNEKQHSLWISIEDEGLFIYDIATGKVQHEFLNVPPSQTAATITSMVADKKGNMYLGDFTYGLYKWLVDEKKFIRFSRNDGMASDAVNEIRMDEDDNIWLATNEGISRFGVSSGIFTNYNEADGVPLIIDNIRSGDSGYMYTRYNAGFFKWNIHDFDTVQERGTIYIRSAKLFGNNMAIDSSYELEYQQNNLLFQFGILTAIPGNSILEYSVNNEPFTKLNGANIIQFSKLAAGNYRLLVRQKNVPDNQFVINIKIANPYWKRWWFILMLAVLLGVMVYVFIRRRVGAVQKEAAYKQRIVATEIAALRAQMNPHFIFNCLSSIDNFIQDNNADKASDYLNKFAKLIRAILDNSKNETVPFWKDWETLQLYLELEHLRSDHNFTYDLHADEELLNGHYKIPPLIVQPYVENAIHHGLKNRPGKDGIIKITARLKDDQLLYNITDNGVGRKAAQALRDMNRPAHTSYGMQISKERIDHFNTGTGSVRDIMIEDLVNEKGEPTGTSVTVLLTV